MKIGIVGKPSSGKSTFFSAATLIDVPISPRPFTTIDPNKGTTFASFDCVCKELGVKDNPKNSKCENGKRYVPITLIDVAGLVPDAHLGKGLGNRFLDDLMEAEGLIHVVDLSGKTDSFGNPCENYDPQEDIEFLEREIDFWIKGILDRNWEKIQRKAKNSSLSEALYEQVAGLGMRKEKIEDIVNEGFSDTLDLARKIRKYNKPIIIAGNKIDIEEAKANYNKLKDKVIPVSAEAELVLRKAAKLGFIKYFPGSNDFEIIGKMNPAQENALEKIRENVLKPFGSTGVQRVINELVFGELKYIPVYPVENENKMCNKDGEVLPDVFLVKQGSTALDLAYKIHTEIGERFIGAMDVRTKKKLGKEYLLKEKDILKILVR
ncbi:MAG: redox-regulated ATPase YchF [archaeon]